MTTNPISAALVERMRETATDIVHLGMPVALSRGENPIDGLAIALARAFLDGQREQAKADAKIALAFEYPGCRRSCAGHHESEVGEDIAAAIRRAAAERREGKSK